MNEDLLYILFNLVSWQFIFLRTFFQFWNLSVKFLVFKKVLLLWGQLFFLSDFHISHQKCYLSTSFRIQLILLNSVLVLSFVMLRSFLKLLISFLRSIHTVLISLLILLMLDSILLNFSSSRVLIFLNNFSIISSILFLFIVLFKWYPCLLFICNN